MFRRRTKELLMDKAFKGFVYTSIATTGVGLSYLLYQVANIYLVVRPQNMKMLEHELLAEGKDTLQESNKM